MINQTIAHYKITSKLGQGGLGEVYGAVDTKLDREVAIKVLPESFAADTNRVARFNREAKVLAALNHPNIAAIYGIEQSGRAHALIMELVEGETLGERLERDPMTITEALECCQQIAEALEAAHEKGIVHRDLKPENVKIDSEGRVKVLDFGLAKEVIDPGSAINQADSPTLTNLGTLPGQLLGTAPYMSPEQARAKPVDKSAATSGRSAVCCTSASRGNPCSRARTSPRHWPRSSRENPNGPPCRMTRHPPLSCSCASAWPRIASGDCTTSPMPALTSSRPSAIRAVPSFGCLIGPFRKPGNIVALNRRWLLGQ